MALHRFWPNLPNLERQARDLGCKMHFQFLFVISLAYQIELTNGHRPANVLQMSILCFFQEQEGSPFYAFCFHPLIPCSFHLRFKHFLLNGSRGLVNNTRDLLAEGSLD